MKLVPVPHIISYLSHPFVPPVGIILLVEVDCWALAQPALTRQLHPRSIRPYFSRLPGGVRTAWNPPPSSFRTHPERDKAFCKAITRSAVFLHKCLIFHLAVIVDLSKQGQTLACEPDRVVVELVNHLLMIVILIPAKPPVCRVPIARFVGFNLAQRLVFVKVGIPTGMSESSYLSRSKVGRPE